MHNAGTNRIKFASLDMIGFDIFFRKSAPNFQGRGGEGRYRGDPLAGGFLTCKEGSKTEW